MEERQRRTLLARVNKHLNDTLTREWRTFRIDDSDALEIEISFEQEAATGRAHRSFLKLSIAETTQDQQKYYFNIRDRSKGFFWFFNFVMKLEFNPKVVESSDQATIYLLDEPGSYLHSTAQRRLCKKLMSISKTSRVIYCTHSHYLLDPTQIPLGSIQVAFKNSNGSISLSPLYNYKGTRSEQRSAFQPVLDALEVQQFSLELGTTPTVITEGIFDYYALEMFKGGANFSVLPGTGADSIQYHIARYISWQVPFTALWDNDEEGRKAERKAFRNFGEVIAERHFRKLPIKGSRAKNRILQNCFSGDDLKMIKEQLGIPRNATFEKTIMLLFHSPNREQIIARISDETLRNFREVVALVTPSLA